MLVRCARCQAVYSVQDGLTGPVQRSFAVECGRCLAVFQTHSAQVGENLRTVSSRRVSTPTPPKQGAMVLPAASDSGILRPAIYGPVARHNPLTRGGAIALGIFVVVSLVAFVVLKRPRISRDPAAVADEARAALLLDDDASLGRAATLFAEASRLAAGSASFDADRALALLLRGSAKRDVAERLEGIFSADPASTAEREAGLRDGARLIQEGSAAANAALDRDRADAAAQRSVALAAALTSGNPRSLLESASRGGDDPLLTLVRATAELAGGREGAQDRAAAALTAAKRAEPRLLRAQVDAAALALDRRDLAAARQDLHDVLEVNPKHERAKRLLSLLPR